VVRAMYWQPAPDGASAIPVPGSSKFLIALFCTGIILLGVFPRPLLAMLQ
jgi:NADH:ubiquinone oxidoreductase subunit 2 (subunit N)